MRIVCRYCLLPAIFPLLLLAQPTTAQQPASPDEQTLKSAGIKTDAASLVEFFKKRTPGGVSRDEVQALVKQLGDKDAAARDKAAADLISMGTLAVPALRQAANDFDSPDGATKARACLQAIDGGGGSSLASSAARLVAQTRPAGIVEALLGYAPFAEDDTVVEEISRALSTVAVRDGKIDPALTKSLKDEVPIRRALAGEVLSRSNVAEGRDAVRYLLQDAKPSVRLRAAMALAEARDAEAITVLINLLSDLPPDQTRTVEDYLVQLAGEWTVTTPQGNDAIARKMRREIWNAWWNATEGPTLLDEVLSRSLDDAGREKAEDLIKQLADPKQDVRDKAMTDLLAMGGVVVPLLRKATEGDEKIAGPAQKCIQLLLDKGAYKPLASAAPRLLAVRKPQGGVAALLNYLPFAEDDTAQAEVQAALVAMATRDGKADPALVKALSDKLPMRRAVAAEVLAQTALEDNRQAVYKLLEDDDVATVRLRAALAVAGAGDKKAVPVLLSLLTDAPVNQAMHVEEYLRSVAGEKSPEASLSDEKMKADKVREAWAAWWKAQPDDFALPRQEQQGTRLLGYTLIVEQYSPVRGTGKVMELDAAGRVRWSVEGLQAPNDAQVLPGDKLLISEMNMNRILEREIKSGKIVWERSVPTGVVGAKRLANGNTFIAGRGQIVEVDKSGKEVFNFPRPNHDVMAAARLKDGTTAVLNYGWQYVRVDAQGKEVKSGRIAGLQNFNVNPGGVEFLPNDRFLIANQPQGKVMEVDLNGKVLWEASIAQPIGVSRLPNGHTLVSCMNAARCVELDRAGKVVWEYKDNIRPMMARRR